MNPIFLNSVTRTILDHKRKKGAPKEYSQDELSREIEQLNKTILRSLKDAFLIGIGILSASFGIKGFLIPNGLIDGGITGISLLITLITNIPIAVAIFILNIPFIIMGARIVTKMFSLKTVLAIAGLAVCLALIDYAVITSDKLLAAVFGGFFIGIGTGLSVRGGAVIDGTEILAIHVSKKMSMTIGDIILVINVIIFSAAAYLLSVDAALYSILTYIAASKTVDFVIEGIEEYTAITIVSSNSNAIRSMIIDKLGRGVTILKGKGGYGKRGEVLKDIDVLFTVVTRLEVSKLNAEIDRIDPEAFVVMDSIKDTKGGMIKKRPLKE